MQEAQIFAFTTASPITLYELTNECDVSMDWDPEPRCSGAARRNIHCSMGHRGYQ